LEELIQKFGKEIFEQIGNERPSVFNSTSLMSKLMLWSMQKPELKVNLFRLVDVLPQLRSHSEIAKHVAEYLSPCADSLGGIIGWGLAGSSNSARARLASVFVRRGVKEMAKMFIAGTDAEDAFSKLKNLRNNNLSFTVDLLGEYCVSEKEAQIYLDRYITAIRTLAANKNKFAESIIQTHPLDSSPICVSVKLSALYSQCSALNFSRSVDILADRLSLIVAEARKAKAFVYVDAEDSSNNPIIYQTFKKVFSSSEFKDFPYPGIVVQAYSKNSLEILEDLKIYARKRESKLAIRLVKGAYWDSETVACQQMGWESPLWSRKVESDFHFEKLSCFLIDNKNYFVPAFASHNIRSLSHAIIYAQESGLDKTDFELQMLYGMAEPIAKTFSKRGYLVRLYVPLGNLIVGMGYLVRRLLENTSNESFLKHTFFDSDKINELLNSPQI
jgi:RHH-type proline utilization regulon transcriptional repressor/proline dehydrogenase/delta 1-pyrroline-5-carboxylate dehydrogenase